jgi:O-antigen/teichoic acid export membrane protein
MFMTTSGIVVSILTIGVGMLVVRDSPYWSGTDKVRSLHAHIIKFGVIIFMMSLLVFLLPEQLGRWIFAEQNGKSTLILLLIYLGTECLIEICNSYLRASRCHYYVANINVSRSLVKVLSLFLSSLNDSFDINESLMFLLAMEFTLGSIVIIFIYRTLKKMPYEGLPIESVANKNDSKRGFVSLFMITNLAYAITGMSDRYFILHNLGPAELVTYSVYIILMSPIVMLYGAVTYIIGPDLSHLKSDKEGSNKLIKKTLHFFIVFAFYLVTLIFCNRSMILDALGRDNFKINTLWFASITLSTSILGIHLIQMSKITLFGHLRKFLPYLLLISILSLPVNFVFINQFKEFGIFLASLTTNLLLTTTSTCFLQIFDREDSYLNSTQIRFIIGRLFLAIIIVISFEILGEGNTSGLLLVNTIIVVTFARELRVWRKGAKT